MADTTRMVTDSAQPFVVGDKVWRGIDTYNDANKLDTGYAQTISNLQLDGGSLVLRNGWQGLLQPSELNTNPISITFSGGGVATINGTFSSILSVGLQVKFAVSGGALPTEIDTTTTYYVVGTPTTTTFNVSASVGGSAITFASAGTGTQTVVPQAGDSNGVYEMVPIKNAAGVTSNFVYTSGGEIRVFNTTTNTYTTY